MNVANIETCHDESGAHDDDNTEENNEDEDDTYVSDVVNDFGDNGNGVDAAQFFGDLTTFMVMITERLTIMICLLLSARMKRM